jgi:hypothetical protein
MTEYWEVEKLAFSGWVTDTDEEPWFETEQAALDWALKLATIHQGVRIKHVTAEYRMIK